MLFAIIPGMKLGQAPEVNCCYAESHAAFHFFLPCPIAPHSHLLTLYDGVFLGLGPEFFNNMDSPNNAFGAEDSKAWMYNNMDAPSNARGLEVRVSGLRFCHRLVRSQAVRRVFSRGLSESACLCAG